MKYVVQYYFLCIVKQKERERGRIYLSFCLLANYIKRKENILQRIICIHVFILYTVL